MEHINWYPGHMKKTKDLIKENLKLVDVVIELLDARLPLSSKNPVIDELIHQKKRIVLLNKSDLSDQSITKDWVGYFESKGSIAIPMNSMNGQGLKNLYQKLEQISKAINEKSARKKPLRVMIVGIPNVGKSSLINRIAGKKSAKTGNKPGVTKGKQWINMKGNIQLLDTPGILWPKFEDKEIGLKLAYVGSIKDEVLELSEVALRFIEFLQLNYPEKLKIRYKLETLEEKEPIKILDEICVKRGFILSGDRIDYERAARTIMDEYRTGKIGNISIEKPGQVTGEK